MSDDPTPDEPESPDVDESEWQRQQRLAAVFGDVLPDTTSDERDNDDLAMGRSVCTVNGMVHLKSPRSPFRRILSLEDAPTTVSG